MKNSPHQKKRKLTHSDKVEPSINESSSKNDKKQNVTILEVEMIINGNPKTKAKSYNVEDSQGTEIFKVSSHYEPIEIIGRGTFGVVCSARNNETNERVAIKKISFHRPRSALKALREVKITKHLQTHNAIVKLKDIMIPAFPIMNKEEEEEEENEKRNFKDIYLVFELMKSNLDKTIYSEKEFTDEDYKCFLVQMLLGLRHIHLSNIIHRDMKPDNVLVDESLNLKICDFGLSRAMRISEPEEEETEDAKNVTTSTNCVGTPGFRAPELTLGCSQYGNAVDIWSVGCIFAVLVNKKPLFGGDNTKDNEEQFKVIISKLGTSFIGDIEKLDFIDNYDSLKLVKSVKENSLLPNVVQFSEIFPNLNPVAVNLLESMLLFDPRKRITVEKALRHSYIEQKFEEMKDEFGYNAPFTRLIKKEDEKSVDTIRELLWNEMQSFHHIQNPNYDDDIS